MLYANHDHLFVVLVLVLCQFQMLTVDMCLDLRPLLCITSAMLLYLEYKLNSADWVVNFKVEVKAAGCVYKRLY